jgi:hypothetical protein
VGVIVSVGKDQRSHVAGKTGVVSGTIIKLSILCNQVAGKKDGKMRQLIADLLAGAPYS